jgi:thiol-disulfide isomerase/thioredoxin
MSLRHVHFEEPLPQTSSWIKTAGASAFSSSTLILLMVFLLFVVIAVFYYVSPSSKYSANNEQQYSSEDTQKGTAELLFFYADWCPHCKTAKPVWNSLKTEYQNKTVHGYKILFTEVNCSEETAEVDKLMTQYNVEGYPTIKLLKNGQVIDFDAKPTQENLSQFLNTVLHP